MIYIKKKRVLKINNKINEFFKIKATKKKKILTKKISKKSFKVSIPIFGFFDKPFPDIQVLFTNINIFI